MPVGEPVKYTIINTGTEVAAFGNIGYNSFIEDSSRKFVYRGGYGEAMRYLQPSEQVTFTWAPIEFDKALVGEYTVRIDGTDISAPFVIKE